MPELAQPLARRTALLHAILIGCAVMWLTGAIARWGQWYGDQPYYRAQVRALFEGRLALTHNVEGLALDLAWVDGGVQQVWGLGVPLWQSIWEAIGRVIHLSPFPDRLAMLLGIVLVLYTLLRAWFGPRGDRSFASRGAFLFTALLPSAVTMLRGRTYVYEEAAAYAYGASMLLLAGVIMMVRRPSTARYVLLLAFAGATGLVRPTVWFYGAAAAVIATVLYVRSRGSWRRGLGAVALASGLFVAGGGALYLTNYLRFGSGGEFGHRLNLEDLPGNLYATRFDYPFAKVPTGVAARELVGAMFSRPELTNRRDFYAPRIHVGQAETPRWREYYFTTYTWAYVPFVLAGLGFCAAAWLRVRRRTADGETRGPDLDRETRWLGAWALLGGAPLVVFYLRSPSISSRYLLDIAPTIAVLLVITWRHVATWLARGWFGAVAFAGLALWWGLSATGFRVRRSWLAPQGLGQAYASMREVTDPLPGARLVPDAYDLDDPWLALYIGGDRYVCRCWVDRDREAACDHAAFPGGTDVELVASDRPRMIETWIDPAGSGRDAAPVGSICVAPQARTSALETRLAPPALYGNGTTWDLTTGAIGVATYVFADDPEYVEVEVAPGDGRPAGPELAPAVRAKVQLEELALVSTSSTARGVRLRFAGPHTARYRHGLQVIFLAFGAPDRLDQPISGYNLLRVAWRDHPGGS
jgi:hypothetical protein